MPSLFSSWRPKLQIRLKRLPRLDSTDEEEEEEHQRATSRCRLALENNDFVMDTAPSAGRIRRAEGGGGRRRAVHFSEDPPVISSSVPPAPSCSATALPPASSFPLRSSPPRLPPSAASILHHPRPSPKPQLRSPQFFQQGGPFYDGGEFPTAGEAAENTQPPRPARGGGAGAPRQQQQTSRANVLLQQLRAKETEEGSEADAGPGTQFAGANTVPGPPAGWVFLEFQGETKRSALPPNVRSVEQMKGLFLRCFPSLSPAQLQSPRVKVYIQSAMAPHQLFYELEDIREVTNQSVLKLFEQSLPAQLAHPLIPTSSHHCVPPYPNGQSPRSVGPTEYFSEPEMVALKGEAELSPLRPASVQPHLGGAAQRRMEWREPADPWHTSSAYSSDSSTSGPYARSGSTTPLALRHNHHTLRKVDSLERQLASLSELVRSALLPPCNRELMGANWRELAQLRSDILASDSVTSSTIGPDSMTESASSGVPSTPMMSLGRKIGPTKELVLNQLETIRTELDTLKREAIRNTLRGREMVDRAMERVRSLGGRQRTDQDELEQRREECGQRLEKVQRALKEFEKALENTRASVLNSTRRLRMDEVDELASTLGEIGREAVELKMGVPDLQLDMEEEMRRMMERLNVEEQFLREKVPMVDESLRRCKTLANVMVTMKKLAMVQDERGTAEAKDEGGTAEGTLRNNPSMHFSAPKHTWPQDHSNIPNGNGQKGGQGGFSGTLPPHHPLDVILDELNGDGPAIGGRSAQNHDRHRTPREISASFDLRLPTQQRIHRRGMN